MLSKCKMKRLEIRANFGNMKTELNTHCERTYAPEVS